MKNLKFGLLVCMVSVFVVSCKKHSSPYVPKDYTLTLRPDSTSGQDTYISKLDGQNTDGNTNLNADPEMAIARWSFSNQNYDSATQRAYIKFDSLSKVPATATLTSAVLYLYGNSASGSYPYGNSYFPNSGNPENSCLIQKVTGGNWDQSTLNWNNAPAASSDGEVSIPASTSQWNYNVSVDVTGLVKGMISAPATNYGFCIRLTVENISKVMLFSTSEVSDSTLRPKLVLNYTY